MNIIEGNYIDVVRSEIYPARISFDTHIRCIEKINNAPNVYILPGLVDAHVHIESSMLPPSEFSRIAVRHGTLAAVADPHEIANVLGIDGIDFMLKDAENALFPICFGAPSCVPATQYDCTGKNITAKDIDKLFEQGKVGYLSEMMNFPGVIQNFPDVMEKIAVAKKYGKPIDGHAPQLSGKDLQKYINAGITTDHECSDIIEAEEKIKAGMMILIREGSAAKNFDALCPLIGKYPDKVMLCTDDLHHDDLLKGHINSLIARGLSKGLNLLSLVRAATINPIKYYQLDLGLVQIDDPANFIVINNPEIFSVQKTFFNGNCLYDRNIISNKTKTSTISKYPNRFDAKKVSKSMLSVKAETEQMKAIKVFDGEIFTKQIYFSVQKGVDVIPDIKNDILKIVALDRYKPENPAVAFVNGFGLKKGAIVSTVAHDSHNIIAVGCDDDSLVKVINHIIDIKGGLTITYDDTIIDLNLDIAGIMSSSPAEDVATKYEKLNNAALKNGSILAAPFMTLAFMSLLVIPELKIGTKGLFDVNKFEYLKIH